MLSSERLSNIFPSRTTFWRRTAELSQLDDLLGEKRRLITVFGPGGTGKTRLVQRFAETVLEDATDRFPGGVWFVDLSEVRERHGLLESTANVLGLIADGDSDADLAWAMSTRGPILMIFDNFEQLGPDCRNLLVDWLDRTSDASFLVTSRHRLQLFDERILELHPLPVPQGEPTKPENIKSSPSVALFLDRMPTSIDDCEASDQDLATIAQIVTRLDGLPLAIELAACRTRILTPPDIVKRLDRRFEFLETETESLPSRQTKLRQVLDWSWSLLDVVEQRVAAQLSVFNGGFSVDAAESVIHVPESETPAILNVIQQLRDKSFVSARQTGERSGEIRLFLLQTVKEYLAERLVELELQPIAWANHARYFAERSREWHNAFVYHGKTEAIVLSGCFLTRQNGASRSRSPHSENSV